METKLTTTHSGIAIATAGLLNQRNLAGTVMAVRPREDQTRCGMAGRDLRLAETTLILKHAILPHAAHTHVGIGEEKHVHHKQPSLLPNWQKYPLRQLYSQSA